MVKGSNSEPRTRTEAPSNGDAKILELAKGIQTIWENQKSLAESHERLDEQFAVLTRLTIAALNEVSSRISSGNPDEDMGQITYDLVNEMFQEWRKFRNMPDFRDHMRSWMMGEDVSDLLERSSASETKESEEQPEDDGDEVSEFGGDYESEETSCSEEESSDGDEECECCENALPEGQDADHVYPDGPALSQVPDSVSCS